MNISLQIGDRVMINQRNLNKLTHIFEPTPYIVVYTKGALTKAIAENSDRVVPRNMSHFCIIPKDAAFPNTTSDESDVYNKHVSNDNPNHNNRRYLLRNTQPLADMVLNLNTKHFD